MRTFIVTTIAFSFIAATAASAQAIGSPSSTKSAAPSGTPKAVSSGAPVGHRQPTASDVPSEAKASDQSPEDRELDRKIKSICRGC